MASPVSSSSAAEGGGSSAGSGSNVGTFHCTPREPYGGGSKTAASEGGEEGDSASSSFVSSSAKMAALAPNVNASVASMSPHRREQTTHRDDDSSLLVVNVCGNEHNVVTWACHDGNADPADTAPTLQGGDTPARGDEDCGAAPYERSTRDTVAFCDDSTISTDSAHVSGNQFPVEEGIAWDLPEVLVSAEALWPCGAVPTPTNSSRAPMAGGHMSPLCSLLSVHTTTRNTSSAGNDEEECDDPLGSVSDAALVSMCSDATAAAGEEDSQLLLDRGGDKNAMGRGAAAPSPCCLDPSPVQGPVGQVVAGQRRWSRAAKPVMIVVPSTTSLSSMSTLTRTASSTEVSDHDEERARMALLTSLGVVQVGGPSSAAEPQQQQHNELPQKRILGITDPVLIQNRAREAIRRQRQQLSEAARQQRQGGEVPRAEAAMPCEKGAAHQGTEGGGSSSSVGNEQGTTQPGGRSCSSPSLVQQAGNNTPMFSEAKRAQSKHDDEEEDHPWGSATPPPSILGESGPALSPCRPPPSSPYRPTPGRVVHLDQYHSSENSSTLSHHSRGAAGPIYGHSPTTPSRGPTEEAECHSPHPPATCTHPMRPSSTTGVISPISGSIQVIRSLSRAALVLSPPQDAPNYSQLFHRRASSNSNTPSTPAAPPNTNAPPSMSNSPAVFVEVPSLLSNTTAAQAPDVSSPLFEAAGTMTQWQLPTVFVQQQRRQQQTQDVGSSQDESSAHSSLRRSGGAEHASAQSSSSSRMSRSDAASSDVSAFVTNAMRRYLVSDHHTTAGVSSAAARPLQLLPPLRRDAFGDSSLQQHTTHCEEGPTAAQ